MQSVGSGEKAGQKFSSRAKEPLGTDSHRTISKNSSRCRLLIGHKKCFVLLCPIGEQFLLSPFREFVHDGYYLATVARFVHQAFLTRQRITTDESKNVLDAISRSNSICTEEILFLIIIIGSLRCGGDKKSKKAIAWQGKTTTLHVHHAFLYISLPSTARLPVKMPNFTFCEGRKQAMTKFILFMNLDMVDRNSAPEEFAYIWQSKRVGIITKETEKCEFPFPCDVFVVVSRRGIF